jgi:hypothetical protein
MSVLINKLPPARRDLVDAFYYYARQGAVTTARRFLIQAEATGIALAPDFSEQCAASDRSCHGPIPYPRRPQRLYP